MRMVFIMSLVGFFSAAAIDYAAAELDCTGRHSSCSSTCRGMRDRAACEHNCWNDRNACERTNERARLDERQSREEEQRRRAEVERQIEEQRRRNLQQPSKPGVTNGFLRWR
jgi:hypothetical protein